MGVWNKAAALLFAMALAGCAGNVNPVTGKPINTPVSTSTEAYYGQKANAKMIADYGVYKDAALSATVDRIGQALAKSVVRKSVKYTFTILDDDEINAFALPGGYITITRGALNFANSEAEVAAILGHEIGHVDAFHFRPNRRDSGKTVLSVLLRNSSQNADDLAMAQRLAGTSAKSAAYSQEQEFEADALSIHYMTLAGYDPQAILEALKTEDAKANLDDRGMKGNALAHDIFALDQSHPATPDRVARAVAALKIEAEKAAAEGAPTPSPVSGVAAGAGRDAWLAAVDGMTFGTDPGEGTVEGRRMVNTAFGFSFEAPENFDLWTDHSGAFGVGRNAVLLIETDEPYAGQSLENYVRSAMMDKMDVRDVHPLEIDGYRGATGVIFVDPFAIRLAAVHDRGDHLYQLLYVVPRRTFHDVDAGFMQSLQSFHPLEGAEATPKPPLRLRIVTVAPGDTVESLAERMAVSEKKPDWFRVLNGLGAGEAPKPGTKVKIVVAG